MSAPKFAFKQGFPSKKYINTSQIPEGKDSIQTYINDGMKEITFSGDTKPDSKFLQLLLILNNKYPKTHLPGSLGASYK